MRRLRNDRGAVAVMVALLLVPLLVISALVVDVGALYWRRGELQNAADAVALAIAQDCASGRATCNVTRALALAEETKKISNNNVRSGLATTEAWLHVDKPDDPNRKPPSVKVTVKSTVKFAFAFAPVFGRNDTTAGQSATASWGAPTGGRLLPLIFSWCSFFKQTDGGVPSGTIERTVTFADSAPHNYNATTCAAVPGGFGWLVPEGGTCAVTSSESNTVKSHTGNSPPCDIAIFKALKFTTVLLPLYKNSFGSGAGGSYEVFGYAAFYVTKIAQQGQHIDSFSGYFVKFVDLSNTFTYGSGACDLGTCVVRLTG